jgi:hypothetical protein
MHEESKNNVSTERRADLRRIRLRNYRIEIKLLGEPIYQFRVTDVSSTGAGLLVKEDSGFLGLIEVGQIVDTEFISPDGTEPAGNYRAEIIHITKPTNGINEGHCLVGLLILEKIEPAEN